MERQYPDELYETKLFDRQNDLTVIPNNLPTLKVVDLFKNDDTDDEFFSIQLHSIIGWVFSLLRNNELSPMQITNRKNERYLEINHFQELDDDDFPPVAITLAGTFAESAVIDEATGVVYLGDGTIYESLNHYVEAEKQKHELQKPSQETHGQTTPSTDNTE